MAKSEIEKELDAALEILEESNPYTTWLDKSTLSRVDEWIDTGSYALNAIISGSCFKGIPCGRVTVLAGESQTFKTGFLMRILANAQAEGKHIVIFDSENAIDPDSAEAAGLDTTRVKYVPCKTIEQTRNAIFNFLSRVEEKKLDGKFVIAVDSLSNLQSEMDFKRMDKDNTSQDTGTKARAMKTLMQTLTNLGGLTRTTVICTSHVYDNPMELFPSLEKNMPGGKSVIYLPSVTVQIARKPMKDDGGKTIDKTISVGQKNYSGILLRALTRKNRFIKQYLEVEMYLSFANGLNKYYGLLDLLVGFGIIVQTGSTYQLPDGTKLGYYKNWRQNIDLWENKFIPEIEKKIAVEWKYSSSQQNQDSEQELDEILEDVHEDIDNTEEA
jgi:RecA/RadA recombinase